MIAKPVLYYTAFGQNVTRRTEEPTAGAGTLISSAGRPLQADPKELPHSRRQIEGGNVAGHALFVVGAARGRCDAGAGGGAGGGR